MRVSGIFRALLYFVTLKNFVVCTDWVGDVTSYIIRGSSKYHEIKFMTTLPDDQVFENPLIEKLFINLIEKIPTLRINYGKNLELSSVDSGPEGMIETTKLTGTSSALFLLVLESRSGIQLSTATKFVDSVAKISMYHYNPKYLILSFASRPSDDVEQLLQYGWTKKMLHFTVIEFVEQNEGETDLTEIQEQVAPPIFQFCDVHQFNPFTKNYTRQHWDANRTRIFPKKWNNLWGYPLRIFTAKKSATSTNSSSPFEAVFSILTEKMNCSTKNVQLPVAMNDSDAWRSLYVAVELENIDVTSVPRTYTFGSWNDTQRTTPIRTDEFCALVPILPESEILVSPTFFQAYFLIFSIVLIFWILMRLLGFKSYSWRMFNIGRVLFGVSVAHQPRRAFERIIFTCLLAIFAISSTTIYASITDIALHETAEKKFETFADLVDSGFDAYIHPLDFQRSSDLFTRSLKDLQDRIVQDHAMNRCPDRLAATKNIICFIHDQFAKWSLLQRRYEQHPSMKIARPCLWSDSWGFIVGKPSPYRPRLDKLIMRLHSAGIINKIATVDNALLANTANTKNDWREQLNSSEALRYQLIALGVVGYSLSILAFVAEILIHRVSTYRKLKKPPRCLSPSLFPVKNKIRQKLEKALSNDEK